MDVDQTTFRSQRNRENNYLLDRRVQKTETFTGIDGVNAQDRAVQESMGGIVDRTREHLGPADKAVIQARRLLLQVITTVEAGGTPPGVEPTYYSLHPAEAVLPRGVDWRTLVAPDAPRPEVLQQASRKRWRRRQPSEISARGRYRRRSSGRRSRRAGRCPTRRWC